MKQTSLVSRLMMGLSLCVLSSQTVLQAADDASSVTSERTRMGNADVAGRGRTEWEVTPTLSQALYRNLRPFIYLNRAVDEIDPESRDFIYNTYPFDLPLSEINTGTLHLSRDIPFVDGTGTLLPHLKEGIRKGLNQIIVTDFPDISALQGLRAPLDQRDHQNLQVGLHFFGKLPSVGAGAGIAAATPLASIRNLLDSWASPGSLVVCKHLDFAIASPGTAGLVDLTDGTQRASVLNEIADILNSDGAAQLETLSLRFMHLTSGDVNYLAEQLTARNRAELKRLLFPFNDITDGGMIEAGAIGRLIMDRANLPKLQVLDLRGNSFTDITTWDLDLAVQTRYRHLRRAGIHPLVRLTYHGFSEEQMATAAVRAKTDPLGRFADLDQPTGYSPADTQVLKQSYDGRTNVAQPLSAHFLSRWVYPDSAYRAIGDLLLVLRNGQNRDFTNLDLRDRDLDPSHVLSFLAHASGRQRLALLDLRRAYKTAGADEVFAGDSDDEEALFVDRGGPDQTHEAIANYLGTFGSLQRVSLSSNPLMNRFSKFYGELPDRLPALRAVTLASTGIGSGAGVVVDRDVDDYFGSILIGLPAHRALRLLDYTANILNDADLSTVLSRLKRSGTLGYLSLAKNQIHLERGLAADGYGTSVLNFLREVNAARTPGNTFKLLDLTGNPVPAAVTTALVGAYQDDVRGAPEAPWPVLAIDGVGADLTRTPIQYVSSAHGFLELARAYDCDHLATTARPERVVAETWLNVFEDGSADKITPMYQEAVTEKSRNWVNSLYGAFQADAVAPLNPAVFPAGGADDEARARGYLGAYKVEQTADNVTNRAKLLKYVNDHRALFQGPGGVANRRALFKALTEKEQKYRIYNELSHLTAESAAGPIADATVMERVLAALV